MGEHALQCLILIGLKVVQSKNPEVSNILILPRSAIDRLDTVFLSINNAGLRGWTLWRIRGQACPRERWPGPQGRSFLLTRPGR